MENVGEAEFRKELIINNIEFEKIALRIFLIFSFSIQILISLYFHTHTPRTISTVELYNVATCKCPWHVMLRLILETLIEYKLKLVLIELFYILISYKFFI